MTQKKGKPSDSVPTWIAVGAGLAIVAIWVANWIALGSNEERGSFGDMFGGVNALFSGLAFVGLIYAILLQRQELKLQREELESTREELKGSKEAQQEQNKFVALQTFEGTFFQMVRLLNDVVEAIDIRDADGRLITSGRGSFVFFVNQLWRAHTNAGAGTGAPFNDANAIAAYDAFYLTNGQHLGHYYRVLYNTIKFVDSSAVENKKFYTNVVRALLSDNEVFLLYYNCLSTRGTKFKPLVERYTLLKMLRTQSLFQGARTELYAPTAYDAG